MRQEKRRFRLIAVAVVIGAVAALAAGQAGWFADGGDGRARDGRDVIWMSGPEAPPRPVDTSFTTR
jgi:hypothetical protein